MRVSLIVMLLAAPAWAGAPSPKPPPPPTSSSETAVDALTRGAERMEARDYAGALAAFQRCAQLAPKDDRCPYNGGLAAYLDGKFGVAVEQWKRAKALDARSWRVRAKLIQAYQGAGDLRGRDAERAELFAQRARAAEGDELRTLDSYCREQWTFGAYRVMAFEYFDTNGPGMLLRYRFLIGKDGGAEGAEWLGLASIPSERGRGYGLLKLAGAGGEVVFLAEYASWSTEPSYDELRKVIVAILQGKQKPLRGEPLALP
jgi:tetratricopeptide (TPR) repeat protein